MGVLRTKSIEQSIRDTEESGAQAQKDLSAFDLTVFGVGVIVGTGIFVLTGDRRRRPRPARRWRCRSCSPASPARWPRSATRSSPRPCRWPGQRYTFSYATLGELIAWIIGWDLMLEFALGAAAVAVGWSDVLRSMSWSRPGSRSPAGYGDGAQPGRRGDRARPDRGDLVGIEAQLARQRRHRRHQDGRRAAGHRAPGCSTSTPPTGRPFIPPPGPRRPKAADGVEPAAAASRSCSGSQPRRYGWVGIFTGAAIVFFAFIGFDVVATTAEETRKPQRDMPIGILGVAGHLHRAVRRRLAGAHRDGQVHRARTPPPPGRRLQGGRLRLDRQPGLARRAGRADHGHPHPDAGPEPGLVRHEPRPAAARRAVQRPPPLRHALGDLADHRRDRGPDRHLRAPDRPWPNWSTSAPCSPSCWCRSGSSCCAAPSPTCPGRSAPRPSRWSRSWPWSPACS